MGKKHSQPFYPLTHEEWLKARHELKTADRDVLYYLRTLDPFGDKEIDLTVSGLARNLDLHKSTVSRSLRRLHAQGWIHLEMLQVRVKVKAHALPRNIGVASRQRPLPPSNADGSGSNADGSGSNADGSGSNADGSGSNTESSNRFQCNGSSGSKTKDFKTNQTYQTLSEEEERDFQEWVWKKAEKLPELPQFKDKWIARRREEPDVIEEFKVYRSRCLENQKAREGASFPQAAAAEKFSTVTQMTPEEREESRAALEKVKSKLGFPTRANEGGGDGAA